GREKGSGRTGRRAARPHIRGGARGAARERSEVPPPWASPGRAAGTSPHPRLPNTRLLRWGRRFAAAGAAGMGGGGGGRVRYRPGRGNRGRLRGGRGLEGILPGRGPGGPGPGRLPLLARPPAALPLRGGRGRGGAAPEGAARGSGLVVRTLRGPRRRAPRKAGRLPGGGPLAPDAAPRGGVAPRGGRRGRPQAQGRTPARRCLRLHRGALPGADLAQGRGQGGRPLAGAPHHGRRAQDGEDGPWVDHRAPHGRGAAPPGRDRPVGGGGRSQGGIRGRWLLREDLRARPRHHPARLASRRPPV
ncbi:MAG: Transcriptional regulator, AraC family, partial [uncultured Rubrobacteraceae bacterium]